MLSVVAPKREITCAGTFGCFAVLDHLVNLPFSQLAVSSNT